MKKIVRLGTRGSPLALLQAEEAKKKIIASNRSLAQDLEIEIIPIRTSGDWRPEQKELSFREVGGSKELFTKEIEDALIEGHIDIAVHSLKDLATNLHQSLMIGAVLQRIDPRDAFIGRSARRLGDLPAGAVIGTASLRRQAQILAKRPDLKVVPLRGNVETRLKKLSDGQVDATLLALAGLTRLGLQHVATSIMEPDEMVPAAAQGALGLEIRRRDKEMADLIAPAHSHETGICVNAERALLRALDGSCHTPIGAFAHYHDPHIIHLEGFAARTDGTGMISLSAHGAPEEAETLGQKLGTDMRERLPADFFAA